MVDVKIKKLVGNAVIPSYAHQGDAGLDFYSIEDTMIPGGEIRTVPTGISMEVPEGYVALVWDKSGLASKKGITSMGGVMDSSYRGEYKIILYNASKEDYNIKAGDKIAQILVQQIERVRIKVVDDLSETSRGKGGFGSTGGVSSLEGKV